MINKNYMLFKILLFIGLLFLVSGAGASTTQTYLYDANGNLIQGEGKYYEYNDANKLVKVRHKDLNGPVIAEYFYDYTGQRIKKIENGVTTYYIGKHFEHQVAGTEQTSTSYYFDNAGRVAKKDPLGNLFYYHADHLGGTNVVTDSSGNMVEQIKYYPFGGMREGGTEKYTFTGKEKDKMTDWYYYEARYYNPGFMHFSQADTIVSDPYDPQELNRYVYVKNNPVAFFDSSGHEKIRAFGREWNNEKNSRNYEKALSVQREFGLQEAKAWNNYANELTFAIHVAEVPAALGDASLSLLSGDSVSTVKNSADAAIAMGKLTGIVSEDAPSSISEGAGYVVGQMNFKGSEKISNILTNTGKAYDVATAFSSLVSNSTDLVGAAKTYGSNFNNLNFLVPALKTMNSIADFPGEANKFTNSIKNDSNCYMYVGN